MNTLIFKRSHVKNIALAVTGSAVLAISAQITIPMIVPVTAQTLALMILAVVLKPKVALGAVVLYFIEGAMGLPVFSNFGNGLTRLLSPSGGFLIGFVPAMFAMSVMIRNSRSILGIALALILGNIIFYACGLAQLALFVPADQVLALGFVPFILGDILKIAFATTFASLVKKF